MLCIQQDSIPAYRPSLDPNDVVWSLAYQPTALPTSILDSSVHCVHTHTLNDSPPRPTGTFVGAARTTRLSRAHSVSTTEPPTTTTTRGQTKLRKTKDRRKCKVRATCTVITRGQVKQLQEQKRRAIQRCQAKGRDIRCIRWPPAEGGVKFPCPSCKWVHPNLRSSSTTPNCVWCPTNHKRIAWTKVETYRDSLEQW